MSALENLTIASNWDGDKYCGLPDDVANARVEFLQLIEMMDESTKRREENERLKDELHQRAHNTVGAEMERDELKAQNKVLVEFLKQIEFDEVTGKCMIGCNGDSIDGHGEDCIWNEPYLTAALTGDA